MIISSGVFSFSFENFDSLSPKGRGGGGKSAEMAQNKKFGRSCSISQDQSIIWFFTFKKNLMAPFYGWGSTASRLEPLQGDSLLFTTKFPEISGTHFIDLGRMKGWVDLGATQCFWTGDPGIGNPVIVIYGKVR